MNTEVPAGIVCIAPWNWAGGGARLTLFEEAIDVLDFRSGLQRHEEELPLALVGVSQFDRLLSSGKIRNFVASVVRNDDGIGIGQRGTGVTAQLEGLEHPQLHVRDSLGRGDEAQEDVCAGLQFAGEPQFLAR